VTAKLIKGAGSTLPSTDCGHPFKFGPVNDVMIFVDNSGRRQQAFVLLGVFVGLLLTASIAALSVAAFTDHPVRQAPWPQSAGDAR